MGGGRASQHPCEVVQGRSLRHPSAPVEKVKELWFGCGGWGEWGLGDAYQGTRGKIEGRQQWDRKNLLDIDDGDKIVVWQFVVSGGSVPGFGAQMRDGSDYLGSVG